MSARTAAITLSLLILGAAGGALAAKPCKRLCREQVAACVTDARTRLVCGDLHGHDRRDCRRELKHTIRTCKSMRGPILATCKTSTTPDACSPSGAFVD